MTDPYGYQAQPGAGHVYQVPAATKRPSAATTVLAALLGLLLAGVTAAIPIHVAIQVSDLGAGIGELKGGVLTANALFAGAALLLLIAALISFFRSVAAAIFLLLGSLLALVSLFLEAPLFEADYGMYFESVFGFESIDSWFRLGVLVLAPLVLIFAVLPSTFRFLRRGKTEPPQQQWNQPPTGYGQPRQLPPGAPQQPYGGYGPPSQGGPPQQW